MRTIMSGMFMSVDGVIEADDDWQFAYFDEELFASVTAAWDAADTVLMGRRSFEGYRALRQEHPDSPMLAFLDRAQRYVLSTTLADPAWPGTTVLGEDVFARIAQLRAEPGTSILVAGSPSVVRGLLARDLLDEFAITMLPIVVGAGDRLFGDHGAREFDRLPLTLASTRTLGSGAVELIYRRSDRTT